MNPVYIWNDLLVRGTLNLLTGKPKCGKSCYTRALAAAVSEGKPFMERQTSKSAVLILTLNDSLIHSACHFAALGCPRDSSIRLANKISSDLNENLKALETEVKANPDLGLIVIDSMQKFIRGKGKRKIDRLAQLAWDHKVCVLGITMSGKGWDRDPFDSMILSPGYREHSSTDLALVKQHDRYMFCAETTIGQNIPLTDLLVQTTDISGARLTRDYKLGATVKRDHRGNIIPSRARDN